jgi:hypothetical protein
MGMSQDTSALNKIGQAKQQAPAYAQPYANKMTSMVKAAGGAQEQQLAAQRAASQLAPINTKQIASSQNAQQQQEVARRALAPQTQSQATRAPAPQPMQSRSVGNGANAFLKKAGPLPSGVMRKKAGGLAAGHKQADGVAKKGKTRAMQVKMAGGGKTKKYC